MATFAHGKNGIAYDAHVDADLTAYLLRYNAPTVFAWMMDAHAFKQISDLDTNGDPTAEHTGITDHGDGTYTNPPVPIPPEEPAEPEEE